MSGKHGIKETMEVFKASDEFLVYLVGRLKDGLDYSDGLDLMNKLISDSKFKDKLVAAADNIKKVPSELSDIDIMEAIVLAKAGLDMTKNIVTELKKK